MTDKIYRAELKHTRLSTTIWRQVLARSEQEARLKFHRAFADYEIIAVTQLNEETKS